MTDFGKGWMSMRTRNIEQRMTCKERQIIASYNFFDEDDISTERLLALVCDDCDCEVNEVVEVLRKYG